MTALLIGRRHWLRLIGAQARWVHGASATRTAGTTLLLAGAAGRITTATTGLTRTAHQRLARANGTAVERLAWRGRGAGWSTWTRRRGGGGTRHWPSLHLLLLLQPLDQVRTGRNNRARLRLASQRTTALGTRSDGRTRSETVTAGLARWIRLRRGPGWNRRARHGAGRRHRRSGRGRGTRRNQMCGHLSHAGGSGQVALRGRGRRRSGTGRWTGRTIKRRDGSKAAARCFGGERLSRA
jgi:hypothetical protein